MASVSYLDLASRKTLSSLLQRKTIRVIVFFICLAPFAQLIYYVAANKAGPDPAQALSHLSGEWALNFLLFTLTITPLRQLTGVQVVVTYRRMLGLYSFFYASLHLLFFVALYLAWDFGDLAAELRERPYITLGFLAWLLLLPLALTSTNAWRRRLKRAWNRLHKLVYLAALIAVLHVWWQLRQSYVDQVFYTALFMMLMIARIQSHKLQK